MLIPAVAIAGSVVVVAGIKRLQRNWHPRGSPGAASQAQGNIAVEEGEGEHVQEEANQQQMIRNKRVVFQSTTGSLHGFLGESVGPSAATFEGSVDASREPLKYVLRLSGMETLQPEGYTVYYVRVAVESHSLALQHQQLPTEKRLWFIRKRYRDFFNVHASIVAAEGSAPEIPVKQYFGNCDRKFLKQRAHSLSTFLWELAHNAHLTGLRCVHDFLWSDVCVPPTMTMLPNTPLLDTNNATGFDIPNLNLDGSVHARYVSPPPAQSLVPLHGRQDTVVKDEHVKIINRASNDIIEAQGQLLLTSSADLQRSFAKDGITFVQEDVLESDDEEDEGDGLHGAYYLRKACGGFLPGIYQWYSGEDDTIYHGARISRMTMMLSRSLEDETSVSASTSIDLEHVHEGQQQIRVRQATVLEDDELRRQLVPRLRFVIILVGSRGDVQPYVALGIALQRQGHYVRVAAHECFREFVTGHRLGFAPLAGDPHELLRMVTENSMFSIKFVKEGVSTQRTWISHILDDAWDACTLPDERLRQEPNTEPRPKREDTTRNIGSGPGFAFAARNSSFRADAIIANPPSFSGWHIAEALGVPLFMSFPMPWSRTTAFPSPFTNAGSSPSAQLNWMSYGAVDRLIWLGSGDIINRWRVRTLRLQPIWTFSARGHRLLHDNKVPFIYPWSAQILPKPRDWGSHINVCGYWFLDDEVAATKQQMKEAKRAHDNAKQGATKGEQETEDGQNSESEQSVLDKEHQLAKNSDDGQNQVGHEEKDEEEDEDEDEEKKFEPDPELASFLDAGSAPIFIGFGSVVVADPEKLSKVIVGAVMALAPTHRFVVQAGWSNLDISSIPPTFSHRVMSLGSVPHRWLFEQCKAVVHHGGAGTTAEAMRAGKPSVVVPFFGDQFFWARRIPEVRVGTSVRDLSVKNLCKAIEGALGVGSRMRAQVLGKTISREKGTDVAIVFVERQFLNYNKIHEVNPEKETGIEVNGTDQPSNEHWRRWPYIEWADKPKKEQLTSLSRRAKVVSQGVIKSFSSQNVKGSPFLGVELNSFSEETTTILRAVGASSASAMSTKSKSFEGASGVSEVADIAAADAPVATTQS